MTRRRGARVDVATPRRAAPQALLDVKKRRLVNVYERTADGTYALMAHDVELARFLHGRGFRLLPAATPEALARYHGGLVPAAQSTNHVRHCHACPRRVSHRRR